MLLLAALIYYSFFYKDAFNFDDSFNDIKMDWDYDE